ncbi:hypothetical protein CRUP_004793 [Coryphaenoides rupestris]|nr:hypothetical protein CRUP_004793 [Coryphaenoides rupestris]
MAEEITVLLPSRSALTSGAVEVKPLANPIGVGDTLVLTLSPATSINCGLWTAGSFTILTWEGQQQAAFPSYTGRASVDTATGTLTLHSVTLADTGVYTVRNTESALTASTSVTVLVGSCGNTRLQMLCWDECEAGWRTVVNHRALTSGAVEVKPLANPIGVGDTLVLTLSPATSINRGLWTAGSFTILTWEGQQQAAFPSYTGRASVDTATGTLTLHSVTLADTGVYTVRNTESALTASTSVTVLEAISNVTLTTNATVFVEFRDSAAFACSAGGSTLAFLWTNGSLAVTGGSEVQVHSDTGGSTLTILNVTRYDRGPLTCNVSNAVSSDASPPLNLTVYYGPDHMELRGDGQNISDVVLGGSDLNVTCSAESHPDAQFQWSFQGVALDTPGPDLVLHSMGEQHSGVYSCVAYNNVTQMYSNITKTIHIVSGSEQLGVTVWLLPILSLSAFLSALSGKSHTRL